MPLEFLIERRRVFMACMHRITFRCIRRLFDTKLGCELTGKGLDRVRVMSG